MTISCNDAVRDLSFEVRRQIRHSHGTKLYEVLFQLSIESFFCSRHGLDRRSDSANHNQSLSSALCCGRAADPFHT